MPTSGYKRNLFGHTSIGSMKLRGEWQPFFGGGICQLKVAYGGIPRQINFGRFGLCVETMAYRSPSSIDVRAKSGTSHFDSSCIH